MSARDPSARVLGLALSLASLLGCGGEDPRPAEVRSAGSWYFTCGDMVSVVDGSCPWGWAAKPGVPLCTAEQVGGTCQILGETCDPKDKCNKLLKCAASDPTYQGMNYICPLTGAR